MNAELGSNSSKRPTYSVHWVQDFRRHSLNLSRNIKPEHYSLFVICLEEAARVYGIDDFPSVWQLNSIPRTIPAAMEKELVFLTKFNFKKLIPY